MKDKQMFRINEARLDYLMTLSGDELVAEICRMTDSVISHLQLLDRVIISGEIDQRKALLTSEVDLRASLGIELLPYGFE
jgi:hypothetical protein